MEEERSKDKNILSEEQENILKQEIKFIQEEFKNRIEEYKKLKDELKNVKKSFHNGLNDYTIQKNLTIEKEQEIESLLSKISKMKKMMTLSINETISKKFYTHLLEISNNKQKEKILLKYFYFLFNIYNFCKIYLDNNKTLDDKDTFDKINKINNFSQNYFTCMNNISNFIDNNQPIQDLLTIIRNEIEIKNILAYSYDILHNLQKEYQEIYIIVKKTYIELFNEMNNIEKQYPFDFLFDFMKNIFAIIDYEKQVEDLKNILNKLIQEKNAKFIEVKNIESVIKTYNRNCKIISNYIKALKSFYYRIKEQNNININKNNNNNINNNEIMRELIDDIEKFKKITIDYDKINSNFDVVTSLSFGTNYTLSEKSSIKSSIIDSKNNIDDNENEKNSDKKSINKTENNNNIDINLELEKKDTNANLTYIKIIKKDNNDSDLNNKSQKIINKKNININKDININNNSFIGKKNNKTMKKQKNSLSKQNMIINYFTTTDKNINKKNQLKKQLNTKSFNNKTNINKNKNTSFNTESNDKNINKIILSKQKYNNDQKLLKSKINAYKLLNNEVKKKINTNSNNSYNFINIKNNNINNNNNNNLSQNIISTKINKDEQNISKTKNINNIDTDKTKTLKIKNKKTKIIIEEKDDNKILSVPNHTNTLKLYNNSEKNTEKEFENKPFLINSKKKYDFIGNNRYNISKKIEQLKKKEPEESIEITMPNKENNINDEFFDSNNIKDSICDEMISQNFGTANSLIRSTTNDYINRLGFKNNVLWSENLYKNKVFKFKSNFKKLNIEKPIDTSSCCASCT